MNAVKYQEEDGLFLSVGLTALGQPRLSRSFNPTRSPYVVTRSRSAPWKMVSGWEMQNLNGENGDRIIGWGY
jgi:hypothetical protein